MDMVHLIFAMTLSSSWSAIPLGDPIWRRASPSDLKLVSEKSIPAKAKEKAYFKCDLEGMRRALKSSPVWHSPGYLDRMSPIEFPWPDGTLVAFKVNHTPTEVGMLFEGVLAKDPAVKIKGQMTKTLVLAEIVGPGLKIGIDIAAQSKHNLYGSFFVASNK